MDCGKIDPVADLTSADTMFDTGYLPGMLKKKTSHNHLLRDSLFIVIETKFSTIKVGFNFFQPNN